MRDMVHPFWTEWIAIGNLADEWTGEKAEAPPAERSRSHRRYYERQLEHWENGNRILNEYNEFLKAELRPLNNVRRRVVEAIQVVGGRS